MLSPDTRCPCGTGLQFGECCLPIHTGERQAPTAEALMRSRFSAFATGSVEWLLTSWHASTRPATLELDPGIRWLRLDIVDTEGGPFGRKAQVEFRAHYRDADGRGELHERSRFVREQGWQYIDGTVS